MEKEYREKMKQSEVEELGSSGCTRESVLVRQRRGQLARRERHDDDYDDDDDDDNSERLQRVSYF